MTSQRPLKVLITLMNGEHRVQVNGSPADVLQIVEVSEGFLRLARVYKEDLASGPETNWRELRAAWNNSSDAIALNALSLLKRGTSRSPS